MYYATVNSETSEKLKDGVSQVRCWYLWIFWVGVHSGSRQNGGASLAASYLSCIVWRPQPAPTGEKRCLLTW